MSSNSLNVLFHITPIKVFKSCYTDFADLIVEHRQLNRFAALYVTVPSLS